MGMSLRRSDHHPRRHGDVLEPSDRRELERAGWRTTLDYREDHVRSRSGRLLESLPTWTAEAERFDGEVAFASAAAPTQEAAWALLRAEIEADRVRSPRHIRLLRG
jgi:hypothetical protein